MFNNYKLKRIINFIIFLKYKYFNNLFKFILKV